MPPFRLTLHVIAIVACSCACASTQKPYNPFKVPRESFYPALKTIAVAPVRLPGDLNDPEPVRALFASAIAARLKNAGIAVVPGTDAGPIIDEKTKEAGGIFDPTTGKPDEAKLRVLNAVIGQELKARFNADALLIPSIRVVNAALSHDQAHWDGASEGAGKGGFWKALMRTHSGTIRALSLLVVLAGSEGQLLYAKGGGIQLLGNVTVGGEFEQRARGELFADGDRNENAIHIALDPLLVGGDAM
jgi:hypothetical protein